ncbi:MAG: hypothetical protein FWD42_05265, partial [Solirubrobacterales bacterium]|nr:hypothetical protein [Solirubrobacterales bacterium]
VQFSEADSPAFSGDGRYVAFHGSVAGISGVYRRDLQSGEVAPVAVAEPADPAISAPDATAPSISEDGRYVAFTSAAALDPEDDTGSGCPQVYRRDMDVPASQPGAYTLVAALDKSAMGLTYARHCEPTQSPRELALDGSQAAGGVAMSADGQRVVFTVLDRSNLTGEANGEPTTPARQVAVRDLATQTTTLVSATPAGQPVAGGGAYPSLASEPEGRTLDERDQPAASSAAISADGSTVAWQGTNVPEQLPSATDVAAGVGKEDVDREVEPLWRRVTDGPAATTRRLLAGAGLNFYFFSSNTQIENSGPVLAGALATEQREFFPPALSEDGSLVAVMANAPTKVGEEDYLHNPASRSNLNRIPPADAYLVRVPREASASVQVKALTATPSFSAPNVRETGVRALAISRDGTRVAFNTERTSFALTEPLLTSPPVEEVNAAYTYEVNVALDTLQRVTTTYNGAPPNGAAGLLSLSGDGHSLAFASQASNLFYGDSVPEASEVYLTRELQTGDEVTPQSVSETPLEPLPAPAWLLNASASPQPGGSVLITAQLPGPGSLQVRALAQLPGFTTGARAKARRVRAPSRRAASSSRANRTRRLNSSRRHRRTKAPAPTLSTRTVAQASAVSGQAGSLQVRVHAGAAYRALIDSRAGLYAVLNLTFTATGHAPLHAQLAVTMRGAPPASARRAARRRPPHTSPPHTSPPHNSPAHRRRSTGAHAGAGR